MRTLFALGFSGSSAPWAPHQSLGVSIKDIEGWWKSSLPTLKKDLESGFPGQTPAPAQAPMPSLMREAPSSGDSSGTILIAVLVLGGAAGAYYFWQKSKKKNGKAAK